MADAFLAGMMRPNLRKTQVSLPVVALVAGTRGMLGAGLGLLLANRLSDDHRRATGLALLSIGVLSTIPLAFGIFGRRSLTEIAPEQPEPNFAASAAA